MAIRVSAFTVDVGTQQQLEVARGEDREIRIAFLDGGAPVDMTGLQACVLTVRSASTGILVFARSYSGFQGAATAGTPRFVIGQSDTSDQQAGVYDVDVTWTDSTGLKEQLLVASPFVVLERIGAPTDTVTAPPSTPVVYGLNWLGGWSTPTGGYQVNDSVQAYDGSLGATAISTFRATVAGVTYYPVSASLVPATGWAYVGQHGGPDTAVSLPLQTGYSTSLLTTDGTNASWVLPVASSAGAVIVEGQAGVRTVRRLTLDEIDAAFAITLTLSTVSNPLEAGASITNPQFTITENQTPSSGSLTGPDSVAHTLSPATLTSVGYGGAASTFSAQTFTDPGTTLNQVYTFTLSLTANGVSKTATATRTFERRAYYGMSATGTYNSAFITALSTSRLQTTALSATAGSYAFAAGGGTSYAHIALEEGWAAPSSIVETNTGLDAQFTTVATGIAVTNANGVSLSYRILKAPLANTDAFTYRAI